MTIPSLTHSINEIPQNIEILRSQQKASSFVAQLILFALNIILVFDLFGFCLCHLSYRRNGYRSYQWFLPCGKISLDIPTFRQDHYKPFFVDLLKEYENHYLDKILWRLYVDGFSVRDIQKILVSLELKPLGKSQISNRVRKHTEAVLENYRRRTITQNYPVLYVDALYENVRFEGKYRKMAVIVVYGLRCDGKRADVLDLYPLLSESEDTYTRVFEHLREIGLKDPVLVVSDCHKGVTAAIKENFPGSCWQRCCIHLMRAVFRALPEKLPAEDLKDFCPKVRDVFFATATRNEAQKKAEDLIRAYEKCYKKAMEIFQDGYLDALSFFDFSLDPKLIRTTNPIERFNRQIRKRSRSSVLYPDVESYLRQIVSYLSERIDPTLSKDYFREDDLKRSAHAHKQGLKELPKQTLAFLVDEDRRFPAETTGTSVSLALADPEKIGSVNLLQCAHMGFYCDIAGKKTIVRAEVDTLVDEKGYAAPGTLSLCAETGGQALDFRTRFYGQNHLEPLLVCSDQPQDLPYYGQLFPKAFVQQDLVSQLKRFASLIPKGDKEKTRKSLSRILTGSHDHGEFDCLFEEFLKDLNLKHPTSADFLRNNSKWLGACFGFKGKPVRKMMTVSSAREILEHTAEKLAGNIPTVEELIQALLDSCDEFYQKSRKRRSVQPKYFLVSP